MFGQVQSNRPNAILFIRTDFASLCVIMGYSGLVVFWCFAWLTILYGQKVGNPLEMRLFLSRIGGFEHQPLPTRQDVNMNVTD